MTNQYGGGWLAAVLVWTVTVIAAVFWAVATVILAVVGLLIVAVVWAAVTIWEWLTTTVVYAAHDLFSLVRYLVTGYCGYGGCGYATFYRYWDHCRRCIRNDMCPYSGERVRPFVPEAGCPVHDADTRLSRWARKVRNGCEQSPWSV